MNEAGRWRFWSKVNLLGGPSACWEWLAATSGGKHRAKPYGHFRIGSQTCRAHRVAWEFERGPVPDGMMVCHRCDNTLCVNPAHLFLGTAEDNARDMVSKGRANPGCRSGEEVAGARLTAVSVECLRVVHGLGIFSQSQLGKWWDTPQTNVSRIVRREAWVCVP